MLNLSNLISFLDKVPNEQVDQVTSTVCRNLAPLLSVVGWVIIVIKIAVPIALVVIGMVKLATAITSKDDKTIKDAQSSLVQKLIVAVVIFLIPTIVSMIMGVIQESSSVQGETYDSCWYTIFNPMSIDTVFSGEWNVE